MAVDHGQAGWEAHATHQELLSWAQTQYEETGKWPGRRYRVEGTRAGNSRLLTKKAAVKTNLKLGGKLVEVIPTRSSFVGKQKGGSH